MSVSITKIYQHTLAGGSEPLADTTLCAYVTIINADTTGAVHATLGAGVKATEEFLPLLNGQAYKFKASSPDQLHVDGTAGQVISVVVHACE